MNRKPHIGGILILCLLAGACATGPATVPVEERRQPAGVPPIEPGAAEPIPPVTAPPGEAPAEARTAPAVVALLAESDRKLGSGQQESAAASIERALRIAPDDPLLWHRLGRVRYAQNRYAEAEALAHKSISLSGGAAHLLEANWSLIAEARTALRDMDGARQARAKAAGYRTR